MWRQEKSLCPGGSELSAMASTQERLLTLQRRFNFIGPILNRCYWRRHYAAGSSNDDGSQLRIAHDRPLLIQLLASALGETSALSIPRHPVRIRRSDYWEGVQVRQRPLRSYKLLAYIDFRLLLSRLGSRPPICNREIAAPGLEVGRPRNASDA
jgi:hypothetical protein